jgi:hypothetical protein
MLMSIRSNAIWPEVSVLILLIAGPATLGRAQGGDVIRPHDPPKNVNVVNTPNVNVTNTPGVTVTNTPTVNVGNTPSVNVANTATVQVSGTPSVEVKNDASTPVITRSTDEPARQPFSTFQTCSTNTNGGTQECTSTFSVPANKELVIEYVSVLSFGFGNPNPARSTITTTAGGASVPYRFLRGDPSPIFNNEFQSNAVVRIYADSGTTVTLTGTQNGNGSTFQFSLSGYYVNVP